MHNTQIKKLVSRNILSLTALLAASPLLLGAKGDGCAAGSRSPAPDVTGEWAITYDDTLDVEIKIGGAVYQQQWRHRHDVTILRAGVTRTTSGPRGAVVVGCREEPTRARGQGRRQGSGWDRRDPTGGRSKDVRRP